MYGTTSSFVLPWATGQPDNALGSENCAVQIGSSYYSWINAVCTNKTQVVCQYRPCKCMLSQKVTVLALTFVLSQSISVAQSACPQGWYNDPNYSTLCYSDVAPSATWDDAGSYCYSVRGYPLPTLPLQLTENEYTSFLAVE